MEFPRWLSNERRAPPAEGLETTVVQGNVSERENHGTPYMYVPYV